jgi:tetratricopeptide (TPR) repeat protein
MAAGFGPPFFFLPPRQAILVTKDSWLLDAGKPALMPDDTSQTMLREALSLDRAGRTAEAEAAYMALLARSPDLPACWYNLGVLQRRARRFEAALASYQQALDRGVSGPEEVHLNRGVIYSDHLRREDLAEKELRTALALNPTYVPALFNLANLHEDRGNRDEALALYEKAAALDPTWHEALARCANLKQISGPDDPVIGRLKQSLAGAGVAAADRASLGFVLGKKLDECGAYDQAFEAYVAANRASRDSTGARGALYDRAQHEKFIDQLIETFSRERFAVMAPIVSASPPIFICGMFRSGSTLTEQVLASHRRVTAGGELDFLPACVRSELAPFPASMAAISGAKLHEIAMRYVKTLSTLFPGRDLVIDKRPDNFLYVGLIKSLFPNAKIINTTRNPLDNCLSVYFLHLDHNMGYALDLMDTGHYYRQYRRLMAHWQSLFPADILDFDYDAFVREPRPAIQRLLAFCGLDWDEACLSFHRASNAVKTASVWQVREPLYRRASGRWRNYARHVDSLRAFLADFYSGPR